MRRFIQGILGIWFGVAAMSGMTSCVTPESQNRDMLGHRAMELTRSDGPAPSAARSSGRALGESGGAGGCSICAH